MSHHAPQQQFPHLFASGDGARPAGPLGSDGMRLLQWCMRRASQRIRLPKALPGKPMPRR
ncbi:MAG: hypothetical protein VKP62_03475 [Candidatus Sericytochromatia bacterium]|nr:hypothetical protein [Candidatus Sericytochromatia bacterium]